MTPFIAVIGGRRRRRMCSLYWLFLLAAVIIDSLKMDHGIHDHRHSHLTNVYCAMADKVLC